MRLRLRHALLVAFLLALANAPAAAADQRICFYVEDRNVIGGSVSGHAFVQLWPQTGADAGRGDLVYGFSPVKTSDGVFGGPGQVTSNADHAWRWKVCHTISDQAYNRAANQIAADVKAPPRYSLGGFNCTDWIYKIADRAGVNLPNGKTFFNLFDPEILHNNLKDAFNKHNRRTPGGGRVYAYGGLLPRSDTRNKRTAPAAARARPRSARRPLVRRPRELRGTESLFDMLDFAFTDPAGTARGLDIRARRRSLPRVDLGAGQPLRLSIAGIRPRTSITEVRYGDGRRTRMGTRFAHTYARPGRYRVRGVAISRTLFKFRFTVDVARTGPSATIGLRMPRGRPHPDGLPRSRPPVIPCAGARGRQRRFDQVIRGTEGADTLTGTPGSDAIFAGGGDDRIRSLGGNDIVFAGGGDDEVSLGAGNDRAEGGAGADVVSGGPGLDRLRGGSGRDRLRGGSGDDAINANEGADRVTGGAGCDQIAGGSGPDHLSGDGARDRIFGGGGNDLIGGGSGSDHLDGGSGGDRIFGRSGWDRLFGDAGGDMLFGGSGRDRIRGGSGRDRLSGGSGDDSLDGGPGRDLTSGR